MQESTYQMFLLWRSMNGHFATYTRLSVALRQSGRPDLSEETVLIAGTVYVLSLYQTSSGDKLSL